MATYRLFGWDTETSEPVQTFTGYEAGVVSVAVSPDGRYALTAGASDNTPGFGIWLKGNRRRYLVQKPGWYWMSPSHPMVATRWPQLPAGWALCGRLTTGGWSVSLSWKARRGCLH